MARGKNIQLYLMDGDVNGRIKCTLANWTGLAFKIPRTALDLCKDRPELKQTGVYLLFGKDENDKSVVYIGQAGVRKNGEGILNRLVEHNRNPKKDYWTEAIALTTSNDSLGPTEISYLEHQFYQLAVKAKRYDVKEAFAASTSKDLSVITDPADETSPQKISFAEISIPIKQESVRNGFHLDIIFRKGPVSVEISNSVSAELLSRIGDIFHAE